jgi:hypothetical protein
VNSLFDVYLGDYNSLQGYRVRSLQRDSAPLIATRFSTGQTGQTDLDLLKSVSVDDLSGGMFQRDWTNPQMVARSIGVYNPNDQKLYPTPPRSSATAVSGGYYPNCKVESPLRSAVAYGAFSAGTYYNLLYVITPGGGYTSLTLPVVWQSNGFSNITGMVLHKQYLFICGMPVGGSYVNVYRYDFNASTWQDMTGGLNRMCSIRGLLYGINYNSDIYSVTNEAAAGAATYTAVDTAGDRTQPVLDFVEFNGAGWIAKIDGIFRFDGVKATKVLTMVTNQLQVFNGALYFVSGMWLYKFDGTNVTRLAFFGTSERIGTTFNGSMSLAANNDYLFAATAVVNTGYTDNDKVSPTASGLKRIYTYDGAAWNLLHESAESFGLTYMPSLVTNGNPQAVLKLYDIFGNTPAGWATNWYTFDLTNLFANTTITTTSKLEITTSEHDAEFPNIYKTAELIEVNYTGMTAGDSLAVSYQLFDGKTWGSWITLGTITSTTPNVLEITNNLTKLYKRAKVSVVATITNNSTLALKGASMRYTLQPRARWRWQGMFMVEGNGTIMDRSGAAITTDANALNNLLTKSIKQKTPSYMLSPDYGIVAAGVNNVALVFTVGGQVPIYTDPYQEYPLVAVKNNAGTWEILRVSGVSYNSGTDVTTITVLERGYLGITPGTINTAAEFHLCYKVYVNRLIRDAPVYDETTYNEQSPSGESQLQREMQLEIIEV